MSGSEALGLAPQRATRDGDELGDQRSYPTERVITLRLSLRHALSEAEAHDFLGSLDADVLLPNNVQRWR